MPHSFNLLPIKTPTRLSGSGPGRIGRAAG